MAKEVIKEKVVSKKKVVSKETNQFFVRKFSEKYNQEIVVIDPLFFIKNLKNSN